MESRAPWNAVTIATAGLMALATATLALASFIHFGNTIPVGVVTIHDPFRGAALPEAIIAVALGVGLLGVLIRLPGTRWLLLTTTVLALAGVTLGLSIVLISSSYRIGDIVYHVSLLALLVLTVVLLLTPAGRQAFGRSSRR